MPMANNSQASPFGRGTAVGRGRGRRPLQKILHFVGTSVAFSFSKLTSVSAFISALSVTLRVPPPPEGRGKSCFAIGKLTFVSG